MVDVLGRLWTGIAQVAEKSIILYGYTGVDMGALPASLDAIHPGLWRASQLGRATGHTVDTGYEALSAELPGGGWPQGALTELLIQQTGIGELRLLAPALATVGGRPVAFLQPPQLLNALALPHIGVPVDKVLVLRPRLSADALWSAEQILKAGSCGALIFWQEAIRADSLRRLQLAARSGSTLFFVVRPLIRATDPSPAELRLTVRPSAEGVRVEVIKRKGPSMAGNLTIELRPSPLLLSPHRRTARVTPGKALELIGERG
ncbi:translesion DNA synthesis-associated protein ImuA [Paraburkholderia fungorum]|uniref:translesion DNA synthesis-associated protein ImuA n=1 Tax=Paraburkholderia fungorum TaxID=134537 RepID=UPI00402B1493